jgi:hypothetical protein
MAEKVGEGKYWEVTLESNIEADVYIKQGVEIIPT